MKIAPICSKLSEFSGELNNILVHTGQHYDSSMKDSFFEQLFIPKPDIDLGVGSATHAIQTAQIMMKFEYVLDQINPFAVMVVGDVNSTIACGLVAVKKNIPIIHVEAGLRSYDRKMPEEINRVLTDQISDILFTTEINAKENLLKEGIADNKIHFVGNVMIDTLLKNISRAADVNDTINNYLPTYNRKFLPGEYALVTLHRPSNVDDPIVFSRLLKAISIISKEIPVIFPIHPRTKKILSSKDWVKWLANESILVIPPVGYLEMLGLMQSALVVLTDSGGIQEETTALGVPCITLRETTERPITIEKGTNILAGTDPELILSEFKNIKENGGKKGKIPDLWDGETSSRIIKIIFNKYLKTTI
jgi:UDP-N-acetylglucosamine 2-epimerase (non-hydrolysing)